MNLLMVEDNEILQNDLKDYFSQHHSNWKIDYVDNGSQALDVIIDKSYDIIVLDIMLPDMNGYEILENMKKFNIKVPVIMLTAKGQLDDKLHAFNLGANDYLTKPFHLEELDARIRSLSKIYGIDEEQKLKYHELLLDLNDFSIKVNDDVLKVTKKEFQILEYLLSNQGIIMPKEQIFDRIWGIESNTPIDIVEVYISKLRKKLKPYNLDNIIKTKKGMGYFIERS